MASDSEIFREIIEANARGETVALATVVKAEGSTPGKVGFKMLVYSDGRILGTVGGGRNEAEVRAQSMGVMRTGEASSRTHQTFGSVFLFCTHFKLRAC